MQLHSLPPGLHRAGFTLIEAMMAVAIVAVVATAGAFEVIKRKPKAELNQAAWEISAELRRARLQAISRNRSCEITFDTTDMTCSTWTDEDDDGSVDAGEEFTADLSDVTDLYMWTWPADTCHFDSRGNFVTASSDNRYQYVYLYVPHAGGKIMYIYPNGQVDLRNQ